MRIITALMCMTTAVVIFSPFANATTWDLVDETSDSKVYIDRSSVENDGVGKKGGNKRKIKTLVSYKTVQRNVNGVSFLSMSFVDVFSCANKTRTTLSSVQYAGETGTGKVVNSHTMGVLLPENITAGSIDELILGEANCNLLSGKW